MKAIILLTVTFILASPAFLAHFKCGEALRFTTGSRAELTVTKIRAEAFESTQIQLMSLCAARKWRCPHTVKEKKHSTCLSVSQGAACIAELDGLLLTIDNEWIKKISK